MSPLNVELYQYNVGIFLHVRFAFIEKHIVSWRQKGVKERHI